MNYAAAAAAAATTATPSGNSTLQRHHENVSKLPVRSFSSGNHVRTNEAKTKTKRPPSPSHVPRTSSPEAETYVLTLLTDRNHHRRMSELRETYFPKEFNKLKAHLTLFHALPASKLDSHILPHVATVARHTAAFRVRASKPFRLKHGIAVAVARDAGGDEGKRVHHELQQPWLRDGFLSVQDAGGCRLHYTIMNKVEDEEKIGQAFTGLSRDFKDDIGTAEGLGLWKYDRGFWRWVKRFDFQGAGES